MAAGLALNLDGACSLAGPFACCGIALGNISWAALKNVQHHSSLLLVYEGQQLLPATLSLQCHVHKRYSACCTSIGRTEAQQMMWTSIKISRGENAMVLIAM